MTAIAQPVSYQHQQPYPHSYTTQSTVEDVSDEESFEGDIDMDEHHRHFYNQQQQQAMYYQQHKQQYGSQDQIAGPSQTQQQQQQHQHQQHHQQQHQQQQQQQQQEQQQLQRANGHGDGEGDEPMEDDDMYSDESSTASIPDENIDFSLTYALHTFVATVEGQASVVKGDSLLLLDDANSYWWLVRVLKTEDVGYIPAENIETPYERLARLNKHRNVDLAAATQQEIQAAEVKGREKPKISILGKGKGTKQEKTEEDGEDSAGRRVFFAPPTYVEHPGRTWSSDEEDESDEEGEEGNMEADEVENSVEEGGEEADSPQHEGEVARVENGVSAGQVSDMEPDDGVEWAEDAAESEQKRVVDLRQQAAAPTRPQPQSNNPFAPRRPEPTTPTQAVASGIAVASTSTTSLASSAGSIILDPAQASNDTRRITMTPSVAQGERGPLLPSAIAAQQANGRAVSGQSVASVASVNSAISAASSARSGTPTSPDDASKKMRKSRKGSKEDLDGGEKKKSRGMLGGLFSRNKNKDKKGIAHNDARSSEDSIVSGAVDMSPASLNRQSEESLGQRGSTSIDARNGLSPPQPTVTSHSLRLQQKDQATQQAYSNKYLKTSPSSDLHSPSAAEAAAAVAQSAAAMRLAASMNGSLGSKRPSSIILSPNPAGPPLLNVIRVFAGEHIKSEASFKTVLINETTSSSDLIRQAMQRFHLSGASTPGTDANYFLTIKDVTGEEMELGPGEKPLSAFQESVQRWTDEQDEGRRLGDFTPTVKRSSISSISSVISLSSHPAIAKLGMNDFSDDSTVKIYLNRRRPGSVQITNGLPEPNSEFSSYSTQLSTVQESSPEFKGSEWSSVTGSPPGRSINSDVTATPPTPQQRFNPSLNVYTGGQASPERFSSPSARFTIQLVIQPSDLPEGSVFDPSSDAIIPRNLLRDRRPSADNGYPSDSRRRLFVLPRNATVVEAIEQGLDRFGIAEGVVDGGDDVEDRAGKRRSMARVRYSLMAATQGDERALAPSSKVLDAYPTPPTLRPMDRPTQEQRRRSRDFSQNAGSLSDLLPTDPVFFLRKVGPRGLSSRFGLADGPMQRQQQNQSDTTTTTREVDGQNPLSPQEIIAAQRAASRATQKALISAHANKQQGIDVVLPDRGTLRSSRLMEGNGEIVRYSYISGDGETYDISELLAEEWNKDDDSPKKGSLLDAPPLRRAGTDQSAYVTAPSTPEPTSDESRDLLQGVLERAAGQPEDKLEQKLQRVINRVKSDSSINRTSGEPVVEPSSSSGRQTPQGRTTPQPRTLSPLPEGRAADVTPRASDSRQANYHQTAVSVNRIISRHRQQPSIASIMSDLSAPTGQEDDDRGSSTPMTATSSTHPTPPISGAIFTRSVSSASPTPRAPVVYQDDFGMKAMMAVIEARAREYKRAEDSKRTSGRMTDKYQVDEVEKMFYGERVDFNGIHPDIRVCFEGLGTRLDRFDKDVDDLLASIRYGGQASDGALQV
ncbi:hypothetical protein BCR39DRAFT_515181 [Naematelia encephala]|uniref:SH3 domain-containing protein n=1 Tax=Naematelia encephala TaxID=71784 RepID=A0A1Y2BJS2_9TREE|nr:hypothetical protein BCR39DRAFT_515181 [Naematelia encephala]